MAQTDDSRIINLLVARDGVPTIVTLETGPPITVHNISWGYDIGDQYAHVTSNISPFVGGAPIDLFFTCDVESISDPSSGEALH